MTLLLDVLLDHFIRYVPAAATKISSRPDVSAPELFPQVRKLLQQLEGCLPFQPLHESGDCYLRRNADEQMYVVTRDVTFDNGDFVSATYLANQLSHSQSDFARQDRAAVFGCPDDVQMNFKDRMRAVSVIFHGATLAWPSNLLKPSPKGEGFDPPRW